MCVQLIPALISGGSAAVESQNRNRSIAEEEGFRTAVGAINRNLAMASYRLEAKQVRNRQQQERQQIAEELGNVDRSESESLGGAAAAAASAGFAGTTVGEIQTKGHQDADRTRGRLLTLQGFREADAEAQIKVLGLQKDSRIITGFSGKVSPISGLEIGLNVTGAAVSGYAAGLTINESF